MMDKQLASAPGAITVVTATVNRSSLVKTCESVQAQTLKPARHCILLQQLSENELPQIPKPSAVPLEIFWDSADGHNIVTAYNEVCAMARTPYIAMLDDDCWWEANHLETLAELMDDTQADFVWSSTILHDVETGKITQRRSNNTPLLGGIDTNEILFRKSCIENWGNHRQSDADPKFPDLLRGIDGKRIERWVKGGAVSAHSRAYTVHYGWRPVPVY